jgi:hypothetical protein
MTEAAPHWHVEGKQIHEQSSLGPGNTGIVQEWVVPYTIEEGPSAGTTHEVRVPVHDFTEAGVRQAITTHLNDVHRVGGLSSRNA